jgi:Flp pilus assembly protein TadG
VLPRRLGRGDETGAALLEFSLVFILFVFILYGLITFGVILAQKQLVTNTAADAARAAVGASDPVAAARTRIESALGAPGSYTHDVQPPYLCGTHTCIKVIITWDYKNHPVVPRAPGLGLVTPEKFGATAVVQIS